ncbi:hypothetical protein scyTo_0002968 [Scyliorhinus torazame]|uniref:Serine/arginine repetitive matrix protein C-terminal domain-containing protein n=1 Tax=Scyliorhinus torazame TaxID=75743 RepID=A0A401PL71_SCYTO|nr:hypothetical protein [Scyliorhinus torazame]
MNGCSKVRENKQQSHHRLRSRSCDSAHSPPPPSKRKKKKKKSEHKRRRSPSYSPAPARKKKKKSSKKHKRNRSEPASTKKRRHSCSLLQFNKPKKEKKGREKTTEKVSSRITFTQRPQVQTF